MTLSPGTAREMTFRAATPRAALDAVKSKLGDAAIIISTREVARGGRREVEILARAPVPGDREDALEDSGWLAPPRNPQGAASLQERLLQRGVGTLVARRIVERAARIPGAADAEAAMPQVIRELVATTTVPWQRRGTACRVVALVGPTGVGKTTTIAKIAARALIEGDLQVALVTTDTFRVGAADHVRRYGDIMDLPTYVVRDARGLAETLERTRRLDLVLIDTAGRSPTEAESFARQLALLRSAPEVEIHLAVAAGTSTAQLRAIRERYDGLGELATLITKVDEAEGPGRLLHAVSMLGRPVAAYTDGQRVPEDLHAVDVDSLAAQVLAQ